MDIKWPQSNMNFYKLGIDSSSIITIQNSGVLEEDFLSYADNFYEAAVTIVKKLIGTESQHTTIAELDLWYFALIYLYRQSLELILKANIFKLVPGEQDRKDIIAQVRHDVGVAFDKIIVLQGIDVEFNSNVKWLNDFFHDISRIDRESDMFRYPFGNDMSVLFNKQTHVDLEATYYNMARAFATMSDYYQTQKFESFSYPDYDPKLIIEGGTYYTQSVVGYKFAERSFYPYYTSYEKCANYLAQIIKEEGKTQLFMPMCYLYRNSIELGLKRMIVEDSHLDLEKALKVLKRKKHSILGLYNSIEPELLAHDNGTDTTLQDVSTYINVFHNIDKTSDLFRYPVNKLLETYFSNPTQLDINNVSCCFQELITFLDSASQMLSVEKECELEYLYNLDF